MVTLGMLAELHHDPESEAVIAMSPGRRPLVKGYLFLLRESLFWLLGRPLLDRPQLLVGSLLMSAPMLGGILIAPGHKYL